MVIKYPDCCDRFPKGKIVIQRHTCVSSSENLNQCYKTLKNCKEYDLCKRKPEASPREESGQGGRRPVSRELWMKQFDRWWSYNWMRRHGEQPEKQEKSEGFRCPKFNKSTNTCEPKVKHRTKCRQKPCKISKNTSCCSSDDSIQVCNPNTHSCSKCKPNSRCPPSPCYCCCHSPPPEPIIIKHRRRRRNYKAWIKEVSCCSESESDHISVCPKRKRRCNVKQNMEDLSKRLQDLKERRDGGNSCYCDRNEVGTAEDKQTSTPGTSRCDRTRRDRQRVDSCFFVTNDAVSLPKSTKFAGALKSVDVKDPTFIPKPQFDWSENYNKIKKEHVQLLEAVCNVISSSKHTPTTADVDDRVAAPEDTQDRLAESKDSETSYGRQLENDLYSLWKNLPKKERNMDCFKDFTKNKREVKLEDCNKFIKKFKNLSPKDSSAGQSADL